MRLEYSYRDETRTFETERAAAVIGRSRDSQTVDLDLSPDRTVSRPHARIWLAGGRYWVEDLGSLRGTLVRGEKIGPGESREVSPGDTIVVGETAIRVVVASGCPAEAGREREANDPHATLPEGTEEQAVSIVEVLDARQPAYSAPAGAEAEIDRRLGLFYDLALQLASETDLDPLLQRIVARLVDIIPGASRGALLLSDSGGTGEVLLRAHLPLGEPAVSTTLARRALARREAFVWEFQEGELTGSILYHGTRSGIYAPLVWRGEALGVVCVDSPHPDAAFSAEDLRLMTAVAHHAAMAVSNHQLQARLRQKMTVLERLLTNFSPKLRQRLLDEAGSGRLRLGGEESEVTILCSDVRGFSSLSAGMAAEDVADMLNHYYYALVEEIFRFGGTIDKFVGDSILAVFGSPESDPRQHEHALRAGFAMQEAMAAVTELRRQRGRPTCEIGIGIHCGRVLHGFIGSPERMEFTVIGDAVNRASRIADGAGSGEVLIGEPVYQRVYPLVQAAVCEVRSKHPGEGTIRAWKVQPR